MRLKWNMNNVSVTRGNMCTCIAKFDNSHIWLQGNAIMSVQSFKAQIQKIAQFCVAKSVEIKYLHEDNEVGTLTEPRENIALFSKHCDAETGEPYYKFFTETSDPVTGRRIINYLAPNEVFDGIWKTSAVRRG